MRIKKQIGYGVFYLCIFALIGLTFAFLNDKPEECPDCAPTPSALLVLYHDFFTIGDGLSGLAEVKNENADLAAAATYTFTFADREDAKVASYSGKVRLAPGERRFVYGVSAEGGGRASRADFTLNNMSWSAARYEPPLAVTLIGEPEVKIGEGAAFVSGKFSGAVGPTRMEVIAVARDSLGFRIGASGTIVRNPASPGAAGNFTVEFPSSEKFAGKMASGTIEVFFYPAAD